MKKLYTSLFLFLLFPFFIISQTLLEKEQITKDYNLVEINNLKNSLTTKELERTSRIDNYINQNPHISRIYYSNNSKYEIFNIIDNKAVYIVTDNDNSAKATRTNFLHNGGGLGLNLEGQNMTIGVWDGENALLTHSEFTGASIIDPPRVTTPDYVINDPYGDHGTHVTGTMIANGTDPFAKGMAPQAKAVSYNWNSDITEVINEASNNALLISNHSYGIPVLDLNGDPNAPTWLMGCYSTGARNWDVIHFDMPYYLQVASAGNGGQSSYAGGTFSGYDKLTGEKNSKNNLVVANASNPGVDGNGDLISLSINSSSSQGPSDDGRIKPDITGDGTGVYSPIATSNIAYDTYMGTSMSAPNVAGSLLLLQQYYNQINSQYMKSSTIKGLVCHTADDDSNKIGPDPIFGWGLLNSKFAAETILDASEGNAFIIENSLDPFGTYSISVNAASIGDLSATLCWTDPAGIDQNTSHNSSIPALVNDLDLRITSPDGNTTYLPWKLQLSNISGSAITGDNLVDTVENIDINAATTGIYTITISHKGLLTGASQDFSLIVTGSDIALGTKENTISDFAIWPNPADKVLNYKFNSINSDRTIITLVDVHGRTVYNDSLSSNNQLISGSINTEALSQGIYFLKINQGNASTTKKVVIK